MKWKKKRNKFRGEMLLLKVYVYSVRFVRYSKYFANFFGRYVKFADVCRPTISSASLENVRQHRLCVCKRSLSFNSLIANNNNNKNIL